jgi:O-antigen/teichoic acid export membrane protein
VPVDYRAPSTCVRSTRGVATHLSAFDVIENAQTDVSGSPEPMDEAPVGGASDAVETVNREELGDKTLTGVRWVSITRFFVEGLALVGSVVLARLLSPSDFGEVAVTMFLLEVAQALNQNGFGAALIQRKVVSRDEIRIEMTIALVLGLMMTLAVLVAAQTVLPDLYGHRIVPLMDTAAPVFTIVGPGAIAAALLSRRMDFRTLGYISIACQLSGVLVSVGLAVAGAGAQSVIVGQMVIVAGGALLQIVVVRPPLPTWRIRGVGDMTWFGIQAALGGITYSVMRNIDYAIVGARLGAQQTGYYFRAWMVASEYPGKVTLIMQQLALPVYSRSTSLEDMRSLRVRIVRVHATVLYPCLAILAGLAPALIPWLFGSKWDGAILPVQLLTASTMLAILSIGVGPLMLAIGKTRLLMFWNMGGLAFYVGMLLLTVSHGIVVVCAATIGSTAVITVANLYVLVHRQLGISARELLTDALPAALGSILTFGVTLGIRSALSAAGWDNVFILAIGVAVGGTVYLTAVALISRQAAEDLRLMARSLLPARLARRLA